MQPIPINLAVEDFLSEAVLRRILRFTKRPYATGTCFCKGGYGYLKKNIAGFNHAAKTTPFLVLTDLDDREAFAKFLGIQLRSIPANVDTISDPKQFLLSLTKKSKKRQLREAIAPAPGSTARVGPDYNGQLGFFVETLWDVALAMKHSPSLQRTVSVVKDFNPHWHVQ